MGNPEQVTNKRTGRKGWEYRFTHPVTNRPTTIRYYLDRRRADAAVAIHIQNLEARAAGLPDNSGWTMTYEDLVKRFLKAYNFPSDERRQAMKVQLELNELNITTVNEFFNTERLTQKAMVIGKATTADHAKRYVQGFLKQLTRWAAAQRIIPQDPLANWETLKLADPRHEPVAFTAQEMVEVLDAADVLDELFGPSKPEARHYRTRLVILTLLATGNRPGAVFNATVSDLRDQRVVLPKGNGTKMNGSATIPAELDEALRSTNGERRATLKDSLLLSRRGKQLNVDNFNDYFRRCVIYAFVKKRWPAGVPDCIDPAAVAHRIYAGKERGRDGPPAIIEEKKKKRQLESQLIEDLAQKIEPQIMARVDALYLYRLRHTHQTWAELAGVKRASIDKQTGHSARDIGGRHYSDKTQFDPWESSAAVWKTLQDAIRAAEEAKQPQQAALAAGAELQNVSVIQSVTRATDLHPPAPAGKAVHKSNDVGSLMAGSTGLEPATFGVTNLQPDKTIIDDMRSPVMVFMGENQFKNQKCDEIRSPAIATSVSDSVSDSKSQPKNPLNHPLQPLILKDQIESLRGVWATLPEATRRAILVMAGLA